MHGFEAISVNNGWEYALVGASIVFSGLVILSFVISQLHKLLLLWDNRASFRQTLKARWKSEPPASETKTFESTPSLVEAKQQYKLLVERMGEPFSLPKLLKMAEGSGLHRPHAAINDLLQEGVILPDETGYYIWNS